MNRNDIEKLLTEIRDGSKSVEEVLNILQDFPYTDLGYAKIDNHREIRTGYPEIVYCAGKTTEQVIGIFRLMATKNNNIIGTRAGKEMYEAVREILPEAVW